jgi:hypothetical protein
VVYGDLRNDCSERRGIGEPEGKPLLKCTEKKIAAIK